MIVVVVEVVVVVVEQEQEKEQKNKNKNKALFSLVRKHKPYYSLAPRFILENHSSSNCIKKECGFTFLLV